MDNQRILLLIAIFFTSFLLWQEWQLKDVKNSPATTDSVATIGGTATAPVTPAIKNNDNTNNVNTEDLPTLNTNLQQTTAEPSQETGSIITVKTDVFTVLISTVGGTIKQVTLNQYPLSLVGQDSEKFVEIVNDIPERYFHIQSGLLAGQQSQLPTHHETFQSQQSFYELTRDNVTGGNVTGDNVTHDKLTVPLTWTNNQGVSVTKLFHFKRNSYLIDISYEITNQSNTVVSASPYVQLARQKPSEKESTMGMSIYNGGAFYNDSYQKVNYDEFASTEKTQAKGGWMAMVQHYFVTAVLPTDKIENYFSSKVINGNYLLSMVNSGSTINPQTTQNTLINQVYVGPKEQRRLERISSELDRTIDYGFLYIIAKPLSWVLNQIYDFVSSWGWSIILLTVLIKLVFYKLSETSYRSMAKMRNLAPQLKRLKESYGDDKQKVSKKMMELYKREKINPASGCLPIVVQIPVFIALYWLLLDSVELRQTPFWWLDDLATKDPYYILPLIMGASMFIQQRLNPQPTDPIQAKVMMFLPVVFTVLFLWFPSGLVLYWVVNNTLSILQQWLITRRLSS